MNDNFLESRMFVVLGAGILVFIAWVVYATAAFTCWAVDYVLSPLTGHVVHLPWIAGLILNIISGSTVMAFDLIVWVCHISNIFYSLVNSGLIPP